MLEPATSNPIPNHIQPPPPPIIVDDEPAFKSPKSLTPILTTVIVPASYYILSVGQSMRALMKKLPGSSLLSLDILPNLLWISTLHIQPSLVLFQVFDLGAIHFSFEVLIELSHSLQVKPILITIISTLSL